VAVPVDTVDFFFLLEVFPLFSIVLFSLFLG
jgi:hypothetical protein